MFYESYPWKKEIRRLIRQINKIVQIPRPDENKIFNFEKYIFLSAYIVRKLIEAQKLSDRVRTISIEVKYFQNIKPVTHMNWTDIWELYEFDNEKTKIIDLEFLCNQIIHSYIFFSPYDEKGFLNSIMVSSDFQRNIELYSIPIEIFTGILTEIAYDQINTIAMHYDSKKKDYVITKAE